MPRPEKPAPPANTPELNIPRELLHQLVSGPMTQGDLEAMFRSLKKSVIERAMGAEMTEHRGYGPGQVKPDGQRNHRNGASPKTVLTDDGPIRIEVPRDRAGSFEAQIIGKHKLLAAVLDLDLRILGVRAAVTEVHPCRVRPDPGVLHQD
jgi:putative transposase